MTFFIFYVSTLSNIKKTLQVFWIKFLYALVEITDIGNKFNKVTWIFKIFHLTAGHFLMIFQVYSLDKSIDIYLTSK